MANPQTVARIPTTLQTPGGAPLDPQAAIMFLTQLQVSLNTWTAMVATAINKLLDQAGL